VRIVFMGSGAFGVPTLRSLAAGGHRIEAVVTQPDAPSGRGRKLAPTAIKSCALELGLEVLDPPKVNERSLVEQLASIEPEAIVVVAYGQILKKRLLELPRLGCFNLHASLLPKYRGVAPINWALINGEQITGVTVIKMDAGIDTGAMVAQKALGVDPEETAGELHDRLAALGAELVPGVLSRLSRGEVELFKQPSDEASYARKLAKEDGIVDWTRDALSVHNLIRGVTPWPGATTRYGGLGLRVLRSSVADLLARPVKPGTVLGVGEKNGILVCTGRGAVELLNVQPESKRPMSGADFKSGYRLDPGEVLGV